MTYTQKVASLATLLRTFSTLDVVAVRDWHQGAECGETWAVDAANLVLAERAAVAA